METGGQPEACEACIVVKRDDMSQFEGGKDLMTVADMIKAGFSALLGFGVKKTKCHEVCHAQNMF